MPPRAVIWSSITGIMPRSGSLTRHGRGVAVRGQWLAALAAEILIARRMLILPVTGSAAGHGVTPGQGAPVSQGG